MSLKVVRDEEDDSGFSRQVTVTWTLPRFRTIYGRARPKQRIKSQPFRVPNVSGFDVSGVVVFFPKGLARSDEAPDTPVVGVEVRHAPRDPDPTADAHQKTQKKRLATPIALEVEAFTDHSGDGDEPDMLGVSLGASVEVEVTKRTAVPHWAMVAARRGSHQEADEEAAGDSPGTTAEDTIEIPHALTVEHMQRVATALTFVVKITLLSHGDDLSDVSDDFGIDAEGRQAHEEGKHQRTHGEEDNLFSQVFHKGQGMFQNLLNDVGATPTRAVPSTATAGGAGSAMSAATDGAPHVKRVDDDDAPPIEVHQMTAANSAAAAANAFVSGAAELFHRHPSDVDYSAEWQPLIDLYCSDDAPPNAWRHFNVGCWSVMVHCLSDMEDLLLHPSTAWVEATAAWSRPSPNAVGAMTSWCPPLRQKLLELVPYRATYKEFWVGFFCLLDTCSRLNPLREAAQLEAVLLRRPAAASDQASSASVGQSQRTAVRNAMQLLSFVLLSLAPDTMPVSSIPRADVEAQLDWVRDATQHLSSSHGASTPTASSAVHAKLQSILAAWQEEEASAMRTHFCMVEYARNICEHGAWSLLARRTLAASAERSAHSVSEVVDAIAMALDTATALANLKDP